jgi:lipopolysaccharide export system permease protein
MFRIIDKYMLRVFCGPLLFGILAFTAIFVGSDLLFTLVELILDGRLSVYSVIGVVLLSLPAIMVLAFPMAVLLGSLLSFSRMSESGEIIAMQTGGVSFYRLIIPVIIIAILLSFTAIWMNEELVPYTDAQKERIIKEAMGERGYQIQRDIVVKNYEKGKISRLIFANTFDPETNIMTNVTMQDFENGVLKRIIEADKVVWEDEKWHFYNGIMYGVGAEAVTVVKFDTQNIYLERTPQQIATKVKQPDKMTARELRQEIKEIQSVGGDISRFAVQYYMKFAISFACLVFALIGVPLGMQPQRRSTSYGFGLSIVIIFIYYIVLTISSTLGQSGDIPPFLGAWAPNIIFMLVGLGLCRKRVVL